MAEPRVDLYIGYVSGVTDEYHAERVRAVIKADRGRPLREIPLATPLLPQMIHVKPKNGEAVVVIRAISGLNEQRWYLGPLISQPGKMEYDGYFTLSPTRFISGGILPPERSIDNYAETEGSLPKNDEIAILGRKNTDIILSEDDLRLRAGVRLTDSANNRVNFNTDAPAFIKLKHHSPALSIGSGETEENTVKSTATVVADKINLLSHEGIHGGLMDDTNEGINNEAMKKIIEQAHRLPYGDILCDFFSLFLKMYFAHSHPYPGMGPLRGDPETKAFLAKYGEEKTDLEEKLLSKNIRIA